MLVHYAREQILLQRYAYSGENSNISDYQAMVDDSDIVYFWRAQSRDAAGRLTSSIVGNGLETNEIGVSVKTPEIGVSVKTPFHLHIQVRRENKPGRTNITN